MGVPIGLPLGREVYTGVELYSTWEDMITTIAGPRRGKTTAYAVPQIMAAPGAVVVTSNKRDIVDATRLPREKLGSVFVFDAQGVYGEQGASARPPWYWDPLTFVTDDVQARELAGHFASGSRRADARTDAFFDPAGKQLLTGCLLAAALTGEPITIVPRWLTQQGSKLQVEILQQYGYQALADIVYGHVTAPVEQCGGIYGTAATMCECLTSRTVIPWITRHDDTRAFDPDWFVRSRGTLYSISREGKGSTGPLVTALTVAVTEAAERYANQCPQGRLPHPMLGMLDEAANVCRWADLPNLYSHFGSKGIILNTVLQSWPQGVEVWGEDGMRKLWGAANIRVYGGGASDRAFTENMSASIGEYERVRLSDSYSQGHRTYSRQVHMEKIFPADALEALPRSRAVIFASGARPALVKTLSWMKAPYASKIRESIRVCEERNRE